MPIRHHQPLTPVALFTAVVVLLLLGAIGSAQLLGARETARRTQCTNNLKQLALAVHFYHDTHNRLPPLATDEGRWTWAAFLLPYHEQGATDRPIDFTNAPKSEENRAIVTALKMPDLLCPSRRTKAARKEGAFKGGQPTDYVGVSTTDLKKFSTGTSGMIIYRAGTTAAAKSGINFGSVIDGLSNTAMLGEKHMLKDWLEGKYDEPALVAHDDQNTIRIASNVEKDKEDGKEVEKLRGLADDKDKDDWKFGSAHPDICLFAMGDASVKPIKNKTEPKILRLLCSRNDRQAFELP